MPKPGTKTSQPNGGESGKLPFHREPDLIRRSSSALFLEPLRGLKAVTPQNGVSHIGSPGGNGLGADFRALSDHVLLNNPRPCQLTLRSPRLKKKPTRC